MNRELYILFYGEGDDRNEFRARPAMTHDEAVADSCLPVKEIYEPNPKIGMMISISKLPSCVINKITFHRCFNNL